MANLNVYGNYDVLDVLLPFALESINSDAPAFVTRRCPHSVLCWEDVWSYEGWEEEEALDMAMGI